MNFLEIGKIVRPHGVKGAVKVVSYLDGVDFSIFKSVFIGKNKVNATITQTKPLNNDAFSINLNIIPDIDTAEKFKNQLVYINRDMYPQFNNKLYLSDCLNKPVVNEHNKIIGTFVGFEDYGASIILNIKCGASVYSLPFVDDIITFDENAQVFKIDQQTFEDMRV